MKRTESLISTGDHNNGALHAVITPTIAYGKCFGHFSAQGTFAVGLPIVDTHIVGRTYSWNNAFQYGEKTEFRNSGLVIGCCTLGRDWASQSAVNARSRRRASTRRITMQFCRFGFHSEHPIRFTVAGHATRRLPSLSPYLTPDALTAAGRRRLASPTKCGNGHAINPGFPIRLSLRFALIDRDRGCGLLPSYLPSNHREK